MPDQTASDVLRNTQDAEDALWEAENTLSIQETLRRGWAVTAMISTPATFVLIWGAVTAQDENLSRFLNTFAFIFILATAISLVAVAVCTYSIIPPLRKNVSLQDRILTRTTLREMGES